MSATTILAIVLPIVTTVGGVVLGWWLNGISTRRTAREEREWAERQTARERQVAAAATLDERVIDALRQLPNVGIDGSIGAGSFRQVRLRLMEAQARAAVLADAEIDRRMRALDMALLVGEHDAQFATASPETSDVNPWPIHVAAVELRMALAHFQRGEEPPPAEFPTAEEVVKLAHPEGRNAGLDGVRYFLMDRGVTSAFISG